MTMPAVGSNHLTRAQWAQRLSDRWREAADNMLQAIYQLGQDLIAAKDDLPHGDFSAMLASDLPFTHRTANRLMAVARDPRLWTQVSNLPPAWGTLYELTRLDDSTFDRLVGDGTIKPDMQRSDVGKVLRLQRVQADEARVLSLRPRPGIYRTLVIDPAWEYDWLSIAGRAKPGYAMQSIEQLRELDLKQWADLENGTHLYCWATNNFIYEALKLIEHWGWQHRTVLTWNKPPPFGLGSYFRNSTEHVLFATLGDTTTRPAAASISTDFDAPRGEHSEKPERFYDIVRAASYPPYGEGNQREPRPDFTSLFETVESPGADTFDAAADAIEANEAAE